MPEPVLSDDLPDWIRDHLERYLRTAGEDGHVWRGVPPLLLTTVGRRSGRPRTTPLIYGRTDDAGYVVVASKGGAPEHPAWFGNLMANDDASIQVKAERADVRARVAEGEERAELWRRMVELWPDYERYAEATERRIPVVVLDPV